MTIEMDGEIAYHQEQLDNPRRVFFDLKGARPIATLLDATLKFDDDVGAGDPARTASAEHDARRVGHGAAWTSYSVFTLYNPYRLVDRLPSQLARR